MTDSQPGDAEIQAELRQQGNIPRHVAIIMDGNGRWAKKRGLPRSKGHRAAREVVRNIVEACCELDIDVLTLFTFGTDNWKRPWGEILSLMKLLRDACREELDELGKNGVRLMATGNTDRLAKHARMALFHTMERTALNEGLKLNLALSYDGRSEIVDAARRLSVDVAKGKLKPEEIDEESLAGALYTADFPDPDLLIRTSGEMRLSNFMLWQCAYTELWFTPVLWPDFNRSHLYDAIRSYQARERRFGKTSSQMNGVNGQLSPAEQPAG
jgi:undecaprenyl diphosphate synthase